MPCENGISVPAAGGGELGELSYDAATNTLTGDDGIVWYRIGIPLEQPSTP